MPMFENAANFIASGQFNEVHGNQTIVTPPAPVVESARTLQSSPNDPTSTGITVRCIRVPANGSPLRLVDLPTTYIRDEDREDSFLYHIPDFRPYWNNGWQYRDFSRFSLDSDSYYYIFYSFHDFQVKLPANKYFSGGVSGDAFIVKIADWEPVIDEWAAYEDVPDQMLGSKELDALFREVA